jgi:hypothetical protein
VCLLRLGLRGDVHVWFCVVQVVLSNIVGLMFVVDPCLIECLSACVLRMRPASSVWLLAWPVACACTGLGWWLDLLGVWF